MKRIVLLVMFIGLDKAMAQPISCDRGVVDQANLLTPAEVDMLNWKRDVYEQIDSTLKITIVTAPDDPYISDSDCVVIWVKYKDSHLWAEKDVHISGRISDKMGKLIAERITLPLWNNESLFLALSATQDAIAKSVTADESAEVIEHQPSLYDRLVDAVVVLMLGLPVLAIMILISLVKRSY